MKPSRTCIVCRQKGIKSEFFRIVSRENKAYYDKFQKENSRGIYLCRNINCLNKCINMIDRNKLNLKVSVDKESLKRVIKDVENELGE